MDGGNHHGSCSQRVAGGASRATLPQTKAEAEATLQAGFAQLQRVAGSEALRILALKYLLSREDHIRQTRAPDDRAVRLLDRFHAGELPWAKEDVLRRR